MREWQFSLPLSIPQLFKSLPFDIPLDFDVPLSGGANQYMELVSKRQLEFSWPRML